MQEHEVLEAAIDPASCAVAIRLKRQAFLQKFDNDQTGRLRGQPESRQIEMWCS
jgi:hypothetical protein